MAWPTAGGMRGGAFRIRRAGEHHACSRRHALSSQRGRSPGPVVAPCLVGLWLYASASLAGGIDHVVTFDDSGIWNRNVQKALVYTLVGGEIAGAVWLGGEDRLGKTFWSAIDSSALGAVSAQALKFIFTRARPSQDPDPNKWFQGSGHYSFPSGEVTAVTSIVTPFIFEYGRDHPAVYALALLPAYDAVARVKVQAHWQTDVLASVGLGTLTGYLAQKRESQVILG